MMMSLKASEPITTGGTMHTRMTIGAAIAVLVALISPSPADANHSWGGYHWARTSNPFSLSIGDNVDSRWDSSFRTALSDWSKSTVLDAVSAAGGTTAKPCKATAGRVEVCNGAYGKTNWLGVASISITGGTHITQGTVKLNDTWFDTPKYNTPAWRNMVTCQEIGHTFGLDHQDENFDNANLGTCMDYTDDPSTNQHPNKHDYDELVTIYSHLDSTSTVGAVAARTAAQQQVGNHRSSWGTRVAGSKSAGQSTFVRDFGHGNLRVTFVTWVR
jgi:hypothetical protein